MVAPFHTKRSDNQVPKRKPIVLEFVTEFAPPSSFLFVYSPLRADKLHLSVVIFDPEMYIYKKKKYASMSLFETQLHLVNRTSKSSVRCRGVFLRRSLSPWHLPSSSFSLCLSLFSFFLGRKSYETRTFKPANLLGWKKRDGFNLFLETSGHHIDEFFLDFVQPLDVPIVTFHAALSADEIPSESLVSRRFCYRFKYFSIRCNSSVKEIIIDLQLEKWRGWKFWKRYFLRG